MRNVVAFCKGGVLALCVAVNIISCNDLSSCNDVDSLNRQAYLNHYADLQRTTQLAKQALQKSSHYSAGKAEAYNHLAFVEIAHMNYAEAHRYLQLALHATDNLVE